MTNTRTTSCPARVRCSFLVALLLATGCPASQPRPVQAPAPDGEAYAAPASAGLTAPTAPVTSGAPAAARGDGKLLPAGLYWIGYETCDDCPPPVAATVLLARDEAEAREALARAPAGLPLGYPLVVHTDELGLADRSIRGIALVLGLHRTPAEGVEWLAALQSETPGARVLRIGEQQYFESGEGEVVVRIAAGAPVAAFARAEVERIENDQREEVAPEILAARLQPLCEVAPGELFLAQRDDLNWYRWAPVRCGSDAAFVPWRASLLGWATVIPGDSGYRLRQVTHVECDRPDIEEWPYDGETGRAAVEERKPGPLGGC